MKIMAKVKSLVSRLVCTPLVVVPSQQRVTNFDATTYSVIHLRTMTIRFTC